MHSKHALLAKTVRVKKLSRDDISIMYELFSVYYQNHTRETFEVDLMEKNHVILLRDKAGKLQGFSTLLRVPLQKNGRRVIGVYSGDTVIHKDFWGTGSLGIEFLKYLWKLKIKSLGTPVYWFLISKGYKTYLLMANNFKKHYPRYEEETPAEYKALMGDFYRMKFKYDYLENEDLIVHSGKSCALKEHVADITPELMGEPRVAFFEQQNPKWREGHELACIAEMTYFMPLKYTLKKTFKSRRK